MSKVIYDESVKSVDDCHFVDNHGREVWMHDKLGSLLIKQLNIYTKSNTLYLYKNGIYVRNEYDLQKAIQYNCRNAKEAFRKEVVKYCEISAPEIEVEDNPNLIGCKNGVFNVLTQSLEDYRKDMFLQHRINANYEPDAYCEAVDHMLDRLSCNDKRTRTLLEEMIGYCLYRNCRYQKCFLLSGNGKNGKSTLLEMIYSLIGEENISALSLKDLQDKFKKAELQDKLVNINDDQSNERITDTADFKKIVTGGVMTMERKNKDPFKYKNYAKLIMSANQIPKSDDKSDGYYRRFIIIPLNARFKNTDKDYDPNITDKITTPEAMSYLLNLAIAGLNRVILNGCFSESELNDKEMQEYKEDNDPVIKFVNEQGIAFFIGATTDHVYEEFNEWFEGEYNKKSVINKTTITRSLKNNFDIDVKVQKVAGKPTRIYVQNEVTHEVTLGQKTEAESVTETQSVTDFDEMEEVFNGELPF